MLPKSFGFEWLTVGAVAVVAAFVGTGCAQPTDLEGMSGTSAKDMAPIASITTASSTATQKAFGITQWKIYRSKSDLHMTGYDKHGKAVSGITTGFVQSPNGKETQLRTRVNDGSGFTAFHGLKTHSNLATSSTMDSDSSAFVKAAFTDSQKMNSLFRAQMLAGPVPTAAAQCGTDLSAVMAQALQCMQSTAKTKAEEAACIVASQNALKSSQTCQNVGTTSTAPSSAAITTAIQQAAQAAQKAAATPAASTSAAAKPAASSSSSSSSSGSTSDDQAKKDAAQDAKQDADDDKQAAADAKQDAAQDAADDKQTAADAKQDAEQDAMDNAPAGGVQGSTATAAQAQNPTTNTTANDTSDPTTFNNGTTQTADATGTTGDTTTGDTTATTSDASFQTASNETSNDAAATNDPMGSDTSNVQANSTNGDVQTASNDTFQPDQSAASSNDSTGTTSFDNNDQSFNTASADDGGGGFSDDGGGGDGDA